MPLSDFGSVAFTHAWARKNGVEVSAAEAGATPITMINARGEPIATPSILVNDGTAFAITRTENPAVVSGGSRRRGGF